MQAYVVAMVDGQRTLIQLAPSAHISVERHWASPADALYLPPGRVTLSISADVVSVQVWEDGANPEDLARQGELEAAPLQLEQDADICPECGHHYLTKGSTAMSHADWLAFNQWLVDGKPAIEAADQ